MAAKLFLGDRSLDVSDFVPPQEEVAEFRKSGKIPDGYFDLENLGSMLPSLAIELKRRKVIFFKKSTVLELIERNVAEDINAFTERYASSVEDLCAEEIIELSDDPLTKGYDIGKIYRLVAEIGFKRRVIDAVGGWSPAKHRRVIEAFSASAGRDVTGRDIVKAFRGRKKVEELTRKKIVNKRGILTTVLVRQGEKPEQKLTGFLSSLFGALAGHLNKRGHNVHAHDPHHLADMFPNWKPGQFGSVKEAAISLLDHIHDRLAKMAEKKKMDKVTGPEGETEPEEKPAKEKAPLGERPERKSTIPRKALFDIVNALVAIAGLTPEQAAKYQDMVQHAEAVTPDAHKEPVPTARAHTTTQPPKDTAVAPTTAVDTSKLSPKERAAEFARRFTVDLLARGITDHDAIVGRIAKLYGKDLSEAEISAIVAQHAPKKDPVVITEKDTQAERAKPGYLDPKKIGAEVDALRAAGKPTALQIMRFLRDEAVKPGGGVLYGHKIKALGRGQYEFDGRVMSSTQITTAINVEAVRDMRDEAKEAAPQPSKKSAAQVRIADALSEAINVAKEKAFVPEKLKEWTPNEARSFTEHFGTVFSKLEYLLGDVKTEKNGKELAAVRKKLRDIVETDDLTELPSIVRSIMALSGLSKSDLKLKEVKDAETRNFAKPFAGIDADEKQQKAVKYYNDLIAQGSSRKEAISLASLNSGVDEKDFVHLLPKEAAQPTAPVQPVAGKDTSNYPGVKSKPLDKMNEEELDTEILKQRLLSEFKGFIVKLLSFFKTSSTEDEYAFIKFKDDLRQGLRGWATDHPNSAAIHALADKLSGIGKLDEKSLKQFAKEFYSETGFTRDDANSSPKKLKEAQELYDKKFGTKPSESNFETMPESAPAQAKEAAPPVSAPVSALAAASQVDRLKIGERKNILGHSVAMNEVGGRKVYMLDNTVVDKGALLKFIRAEANKAAGNVPEKTREATDKDLAEARRLWIASNSGMNRENTEKSAEVFRKLQREEEQRQGRVREGLRPITGPAKDADPRIDYWREVMLGRVYERLLRTYSEHVQSGAKEYEIDSLRKMETFLRSNDNDFLSRVNLRLDVDKFKEIAMKIINSKGVPSDYKPQAMTETPPKPVVEPSPAQKPTAAPTIKPMTKDEWIREFKSRYESAQRASGMDIDAGNEAFEQLYQERKGGFTRVEALVLRREIDAKLRAEADAAKEEADRKATEAAIAAEKSSRKPKEQLDKDFAEAKWEATSFLNSAHSDYQKTIQGYSKGSWAVAKVNGKWDIFHKPTGALLGRAATGFKSRKDAQMVLDAWLKNNPHILRGGADLKPQNEKTTEAEKQPSVDFLRSLSPYAKELVDYADRVKRGESIETGQPLPEPPKSEEAKRVSGQAKEAAQPVKPVPAPVETKPVPVESEMTMQQRLADIAKTGIPQEAVGHRIESAGKDRRNKPLYTVNGAGPFYGGTVATFINEESRRLAGKMPPEKTHAETDKDIDALHATWLRSGKGEKQDLAEESQKMLDKLADEETARQKIVMDNLPLITSPVARKRFFDSEKKRFLALRELHNKLQAAYQGHAEEKDQGGRIAELRKLENLLRTNDDNFWSKADFSGDVERLLRSVKPIVDAMPAQEAPSLPRGPKTAVQEPAEKPADKPKAVTKEEYAQSYHAPGPIDVISANPNVNKIVEEYNDAIALRDYKKAAHALDRAYSLTSPEDKDVRRDLKDAMAEMERAIAATEPPKPAEKTPSPQGPVATPSTRYRTLKHVPNLSEYAKIDEKRARANRALRESKGGENSRLADIAAKLYDDATDDAREMQKEAVKGRAPLADKDLDEKRVRMLHAVHDRLNSLFSEMPSSPKVRDLRVIETALRSNDPEFFSQADLTPLDESSKSFQKFVDSVADYLGLSQALRSKPSAVLSPQEAMAAAKARYSAQAKAKGIEKKETPPEATVTPSTWQRHYNEAQKLEKEGKRDEALAKYKEAQSVYRSEIKQTGTPTMDHAGIKGAIEKIHQAKLQEQEAAEREKARKKVEAANARDAKLDEIHDDLPQNAQDKIRESNKAVQAGDILSASRLYHEAIGMLDTMPPKEMFDHLRSFEEQFHSYSKRIYLGLREKLNEDDLKSGVPDVYRRLDLLDTLERGISANTTGALEKGGEKKAAEIKAMQDAQDWLAVNRDKLPFNLSSGTLTPNQVVALIENAREKKAAPAPVEEKKAKRVSGRAKAKKEKSPESVPEKPTEKEPGKWEKHGKWEKATMDHIDAFDKKTRITVEGEKNGSLFIHKPTKDSAWSVSHGPTGARIAAFDTKDSAKEFVDKLHERVPGLRGAGSDLTPEHMTSRKKEDKAALNDLTAKFRGGQHIMAEIKEEIATKEENRKREAEREAVKRKIDKQEGTAELRPRAKAIDEFVQHIEGLGWEKEADKKASEYASGVYDVFKHPDFDATVVMYKYSSGYREPEVVFGRGSLYNAKKVPGLYPPKQTPEEMKEIIERFIRSHEEKKSARRVSGKAKKANEGAEKAPAIPKQEAEKEQEKAKENTLPGGVTKKVETTPHDKTTILSWKLSSGKPVDVKVRHTTSEVISADGDKITRPVMRLSVAAYVNGGIIGSDLRKLDKPQQVSGKTIVAGIGNLGLTQEQYDAVKGAYDEVKNSPEWQAHEKKKEESRKAAEDDDERRRRIERGMMGGRVSGQARAKKPTAKEKMDASWEKKKKEHTKAAIMDHLIHNDEGVTLASLARFSSDRDTHKEMGLDSGDANDVVEELMEAIDEPEKLKAQIDELKQYHAKAVARGDTTKIRGTGIKHVGQRVPSDRTEAHEARIAHLEGKLASIESASKREKDVKDAGIKGAKSESIGDLAAQFNKISRLGAEPWESEDFKNNLKKFRDLEQKRLEARQREIYQAQNDPKNDPDVVDMPTRNMVLEKLQAFKTGDIGSDIRRVAAGDMSKQPIDVAIERAMDVKKPLPEGLHRGMAPLDVVAALTKQPTEKKASASPEKPTEKELPVVSVKGDISESVYDLQAQFSKLRALKTSPFDNADFQENMAKVQNIEKEKLQRAIDEVRAAENNRGVDQKELQADLRVKLMQKLGDARDKDISDIAMGQRDTFKEALDYVSDVHSELPDTVHSGSSASDIASAIDKHREEALHRTSTPRADERGNAIVRQHLREYRKHVEKKNYGKALDAAMRAHSASFAGDDPAVHRELEHVVISARDGHVAEEASKRNIQRRKMPKLDAEATEKRAVIIEELENRLRAIDSRQQDLLSRDDKNTKKMHAAILGIGDADYWRSATFDSLKNDVVSGKAKELTKRVSGKGAKIPSEAAITKLIGPPKKFEPDRYRNDYSFQRSAAHDLSPLGGVRVQAWYHVASPEKIHYTVSAYQGTAAKDRWLSVDTDSLYDVREFAAAHADVADQHISSERGDK